MELDGKLLLSFIIFLLLAVCLRLGWQPYSELMIGDFNDFKLEQILFFGTLFIQLYLANRNETNPLEIITFQIEGRVFFHITCILLPFILTTLGHLGKLHYIIHYGEDIKPAIMQVIGKQYRPGRWRVSPTYTTYFKPLSDYAPIFQQSDIRREIGYPSYNHSVGCGITPGATEYLRVQFLTRKPSRVSIISVI